MRKILLVLLVVIIVASGGWYFYAKSRQTAPGVPAITDFSAFFPVGEPGDPTLLDGLLSSSTPSQTNQQTIPSAFTQLSAAPVAGFASFVRPVTTTIPADPAVRGSKPVSTTVQSRFVRYVSRSNGYVYEIAPNELPLQISNVYIPNIYEAVFGESFNTALLRFVRSDQRTVATYSVPIPPQNTDGSRTQKEGIYFPDQVLQATVSPTGTQVAYLTPTASGATLSLATFTNTKKTTLIQTPFREWLLSWPTAKSIYIQTKPSASVMGYLYRVDTTEKKIRRVLGDINGLTTSVSPSGTYVLYSQHANNSLVTRLYNTKTNSTDTLSLALLPEKCTWLANEDLMCAGNTSVPQAQYPDAWYQGTVSFSDQLYRISTTNLVHETLYDNSSASFDMTQLSVDETTRTVYFVDKQTGLLWRFIY